MRSITLLQLEWLMEEVLSSQERLAQKRKEVFRGVPFDVLLKEINDRMGGNEWMVKNKPPSLTKEDFTAVSNTRFFKKTGVKLLMLLGMVFLGGAIIVQNFPIVHPYIYYTVVAIASVVFVYLYGKKQAMARRELWKGIEGDNSKESE